MGGVEGDPGSMLSLGLLPAPHPRPWIWYSTLRPLSLVYRWEKLGKHPDGFVCKDGETEAQEEPRLLALVTWALVPGPFVFAWWLMQSGTAIANSDLPTRVQVVPAPPTGL